MADIRVLYINKNRKIIEAEGVFDAVDSYDFFFDSDHFIIGVLVDGKRASSKDLTALEQYACVNTPNSFEVEDKDFNPRGRPLKVKETDFFFLNEINEEDIIQEVKQVHVLLSESLKSSYHKKLVVFNSAIAMNITLDSIINEEYEVDFINIGIGTVTFVQGTSVLTANNGYNLETEKICSILKIINTNFYRLLGSLS